MKTICLVLALVAVSQAAPNNYFKELLRRNRIVPYLKWSDCGNNPARPLKIHKLTVSPDTIKVPGQITVTYDVENAGTISNVDLDIDIRKKIIIGSIPIPCIDGFGSCKYTDLCQHIDAIPDSPVTCPLEPKRLTGTDVVIDLPEIPGGLGGLISNHC